MSWAIGALIGALAACIALYAGPVVIPVPAMKIGATYNLPSLVELSLTCGGNINHRNEGGESALHLAARYGNRDTIDYLLEHDAAFFPNNDNRMPSSIAKASNYRELHAMLAKHEAKVEEAMAQLETSGEIGSEAIVLDFPRESTDSLGRTVLHLATSAGNLKLVRSEIEQGANVNARDNQGFTPVHVACLKGHGHILKYFLTISGVDIEEESEYGWRPIHMSCADRTNSELVRMLTQAGAKVNKKDQQQEWAPLHLAANSGFSLLVDALLAAGANPNIRDAHLQTPLMLGVQNGHLNVSKSLLEYGADVSSADVQGWRAIHHAAKSGKVSVLKELVDEGAKLGVTTERGMTPLHLAAKFGHDSAVRFFLKAGVEIDPKSPKGHTPLHLATKQGHCDVVKILLDGGADFREIDDLEWTALHFAASSSGGCVELLLQQDAKEITKRNLEGRSPLHVAAQSGNVKAVETLLSLGADDTAQDVHGALPVELAKGHEDVVKTFQNVETIRNLKNDAGSLEEVFSALGFGEQYSTIFADEGITEVEHLKLYKEDDFRKLGLKGVHAKLLATFINSLT